MIINSCCIVDVTQATSCSLKPGVNTCFSWNNFSSGATPQEVRWMHSTEQPWQFLDWHFAQTMHEIWRLTAFRFLTNACSWIMFFRWLMWWSRLCLRARSKPARPWWSTDPRTLSCLSREETVDSNMASSRWSKSTRNLLTITSRKRDSELHLFLGTLNNSHNGLKLSGVGSRLIRRGWRVGAGTSMAACAVI